MKINSEQQTYSENSVNDDSVPVSPEQIGVLLVDKEVKEEESHAFIVENGEEIPPCWICLLNEMLAEDDSLINPCLCKGT